MISIQAVHQGNIKVWPDAILSVCALVGVRVCSICVMCVRVDLALEGSGFCIDILIPF